MKEKGMAWDVYTFSSMIDLAASSSSSSSSSSGNGKKAIDAAKA
jgi:hypothetical protein